MDRARRGYSLGVAFHRLVWYCSGDHKGLRNAWLFGWNEFGVSGPWDLGRRCSPRRSGLFAAIPAAIFYNYFGHTLKELGARMDDFSLEFLNLAERSFGE